ncbi:MAG: type II toxin-antitoxin system RelE/ParE family toxin [Acidobacteriia bacterium]|nr:type II toxin-antitoxin system RelE/ParE family toxin [Terriglobia bacterium]
MRTFKTKAFMRFADKAGISDVALCWAVRDAERGLVAANLGGGVIKQRIARSGQGKSGGFRTLIVFRAGTRAIFVHGFAKNEKDNIEKDELVALKKLAAELLGYDDETLAGVVAWGVLLEVKCDEKTIP